MARIKFEDIQDAGMNNSPNYSVGFFGLKNDGDEAIVRIMHDSTDSFDIVSTHAINLNGKYRRVNCCRTPYEPVENCPLCASGNPSQQRFYVHLIQYVRNENGQIVAEPKVWERSLAYATTIKNLIVEYGPLSDVLFKIKRNGAAGSMDTTYSIMYASPNMYPEQAYPKSPNAFDGYSAIGTAVLDKTREELAVFVNEGTFPAPQTQQNQAPIMPDPVPAPQYQQQAYTAPAPTASAVPPQTPTITRPQRYY